MKAYIAQCKAEFLRNFRNKFFIIFSVLMPVAFYFIFTSVIGDDKIVGGAQWKAYYLMSMTVFSVIGAAIFNLGSRIAYEQKKGWVKLLRVTPLPDGAYIGAKIFAQSLINIFIILVLFLVGAFVKKIDLTFSQWIMAGMWILIGVLPFLALGVLIGSLNNPDLTNVVANILNMGLAVLGGLWMPMEIMPKLMQAIGKWLPSYLYGSGAWNIVAGKSVEISNILILMGYGVIFLGITIYIMKRQEAV
jgi:ABC-2 type transport system permease protein